MNCGTARPFDENGQVSIGKDACGDGDDDRRAMLAEVLRPPWEARSTPRSG
jgi:hypothetical protein